MSDINPIDCGAKIFLCRECVKCLTIRLELAEGQIAKDKTTQWYVYDPENGVEIHGSENEARADAEAAVEHYADKSTEGWHPDIGQLQWGRLVPYQWACEDNRRDAPEGSDHDYICNYVLMTVR